ncbi:MAG: type I-A CRISPR-associated protein Cas4/Csa1, partial [Anaerolineae bacterium]
VPDRAGPALAQIPDDDREAIARNCAALVRFEADRVIARVQDIVSRQPHIGEDSLVALALPVVFEHRLDGSFLGLSRSLSTDAMLISEPMVVDVKFGEPREFHRLTTTAYAMVMESVYEYPVDIGCLVYVSFAGGRVSVTRDLHIIDDELRQQFIEERDTKMRIVFEEIDPGKGETCHPSCPYYDECAQAGAQTKNG